MWVLRDTFLINYLCHNSQRQFNVFNINTEQPHIAIKSNTEINSFVQLHMRYKLRLKKELSTENTTQHIWMPALERAKLMLDLLWSKKNNQWKRVCSNTWALWQPITWLAYGYHIQNIHKDIPWKWNQTAQVIQWSGSQLKIQGIRVQLPMAVRDSSFLQVI
jgi:hypothetical protein